MTTARGSNILKIGFNLASRAAVWWFILSGSVQATETADVYLSGYGVGGFFEDQKVNVVSRDAVATNIRSGAGVGLKVGIFPEFTGRVIGIEIEYFGTFQRLSFVFPVNGVVAQGSTGLAVMNSLANLVVRWPYGRLRPYAGVGIGYSSAILIDPTILGRNTGDWDSTAAFSYQFIAGVQGNISERMFLFAEYKRLAADFHWNGFGFDLRANYAAVGIGYNF